VGIGDLGPFWLSLRVAGLATVLVVAVGLPMAQLLARGRFFGRPVLAGLLALPLVLPPTVMGYALLRILGRKGPVGAILEEGLGLVVVFHWSGAAIASALAAFPLFLLPARGAIEAVDPALEDAARLLGHGEASVFCRVTAPLAWRGLAAGCALAFARALGDFGATLMVAGNIPGRTQTASLAIYDAALAGQWVRANVLATLVGLVAAAAVAVAQGVGASRRPSGRSS